MLSDAGISPSEVLRAADLPEDLFARSDVQLHSPQYCRLWQAIADISGDECIGLRIGSSVSVEAFDPPIFAALCSRNLNQALERISRYKRLIAPARLHVHIDAVYTSVEFEWLEPSIQPPAVLIDGELSFLFNLARIGTRAPIFPAEIFSASTCSKPSAYIEMFGKVPTLGSRTRLVFHGSDATRPFLTTNQRMWEIFEPNLRKRLSDLDQSASISERVRSALLEMLPGGKVASAEVLSEKLAMSSRTLQRRLKDEGSSFNGVLNQTRKELATHYLANPQLSNSQISFLLGFEDPNSFYRAFHKWTGTTPDNVRRVNAQRL